jgi:hypothetical protein
MNVNSRSCDVVMARDVPTSTSAPVAPTPAETVDVSPDRAVRTIVLAPNKAEGAKFASLQGIEPVAIVTPRSEHAAHGSVADCILEAPGLTDEHREQLLPHVTPCLATSTDAEGER